MRKYIIYLSVLVTFSCQKLEDINPKVYAEWTITYLDGTTEVYSKDIDPTNDLTMDVNSCLIFKYDLKTIRCNVKSYQRTK
jgi:hypothetical protein